MMMIIIVVMRIKVMKVIIMIMMMMVKISPNAYLRKHTCHQLLLFSSLNEPRGCLWLSFCTPPALNEASVKDPCASTHC